MPPFSAQIVCCYLYPITKYGYPPPAKNTHLYLQEMKELGFQSVELEGIRSEHLWEIYNQRHQIHQQLQLLNLSVPYFCAVLPGLGSADAKRRDHSLELFQRGCEIAQLFGAKGILDNGPLPPYEFPEDIPITRHYEADSLQMARFPAHLNWDDYWKDLIRTYQKACDIAADFGLTYQIHPAIGVLTANTDGFLYFAQAVNRPNLRFNFDTANLFVLKENLPLSFMRLAPYVDYIHISDNGGLCNEHLSIGTGNIYWKSFMDTVKNSGFKGHWGIDIGGSESHVLNLNQAYRNGAEWLEDVMKFGLFLSPQSYKASEYNDLAQTQNRD